MEPVYSISNYSEFQKQLSDSKGSSQKPLLDVPEDQGLASLRSCQALVSVGATDQAEMKPSGGGNSLTPLDIHDVLVEASEEVNFDWPDSQPIERIKAGLAEIALALLLFAGLVAFCLQRF